MDAKCEKVYSSPGFPFCFQQRTGRRLYFNWHYHHEYELTIILQGKGQLFVGRNVSDYENINMILIGPDVPHAFASDLNLPSDFFKSNIIQFSSSRIGLEHQPRHDFLPVYRLFNNARGGIRFSLETTMAVMEIIEPLEADSGLSGLIDLLKIVDLLSRDDYAKILCTNPVPSDLLSNELSEVEKVRQFIFKNFYEDIPLSTAADTANLSIPSFCRFFRKNFNTTFIKYLTTVRISAACKFLIQSDMPISTICFRVGFNNLSNFNRRFFDEKMQTPRQYRKQYRHERCPRDASPQPHAFGCR
jgi:AraC-like DNA-binding protein